MGEQGDPDRVRRPLVQIVRQPLVDLLARHGLQLGPHAQVDGLVADEGLGVLGAPPVELVATLPPVPPVPLPDHRGHPSVGGRLVLAAERELPAHLGLELDVAAALGLGRLVQGAPGTGREPGPVEEDAGPVDHPGAEVAVGQLLHDPLAVPVWNCHRSGVSVAAARSTLRASFLPVKWAP